MADSECVRTDFCQSQNLLPADQGTSDIRHIVGQNIRHWREFVNCPLKYLACQVGVSISVCSQWEHGHRFPTIDHLVTLARVFNCRPACLLCTGFRPQLTARECVSRFAESKKRGIAVNSQVSV